MVRDMVIWLGIWLGLELQRYHLSLVDTDFAIVSPKTFYSEVIVGQDQLSGGAAVDLAVLLVATLVHRLEKVIHRCREVLSLPMQGASREGRGEERRERERSMNLPLLSILYTPGGVCT